MTLPKRKSPPEPAPPRGRGRPPKPADAPEPERTTINFPPGTKDAVRRAQAALLMLGDEAPKDFSAFIVAAAQKECEAIMKRYASATSAPRKPAK